MLVSLLLSSLAVSAENGNALPRRGGGFSGETGSIGSSQAGPTLPQDEFNPSKENDDTLTYREMDLHGAVKRVDSDHQQSTDLPPPYREQNSEELLAELATLRRQGTTFRDAMGRFQGDLNSIEDGVNQRINGLQESFNISTDRTRKDISNLTLDLTSAKTEIASLRRAVEELQARLAVAGSSALKNLYTPMDDSEEEEPRPQVRAKSKPSAGSSALKNPYTPMDDREEEEPKPQVRAKSKPSYKGDLF